MAASRGGAVTLVALLAVCLFVSAVHPAALNCSYHPGTDTVSCVSADAAARNATASRNLRVTCSPGTLKETVLRRDHFGRQPKLKSLAIDGCRIAKVRLLPIRILLLLSSFRNSVFWCGKGFV